MNKLNMVKTLLVIFVMLYVTGACKKDESYTQVTDFERSIHNAINKHRVSVKKPEMVLCLLMMDNAQQYSAKLANGTQTFGVEGIIPELNDLQTNLGGTASSVWVATCQYENTDSVMNIVLSNAEIKTTIEGNYNQSAVGTVKSTVGTYYITHLLMNIPKKVK